MHYESNLTTASTDSINSFTKCIYVNITEISSSYDQAVGIKKSVNLLLFIRLSH